MNFKNIRNSVSAGKKLMGKKFSQNLVIEKGFSKFLGKLFIE
jgi:hypothetical protein